MQFVLAYWRLRLTHMFSTPKFTVEIALGYWCSLPVAFMLTVM